jgi:ribosomal protein S18 acetylase RimI-like enzyme
MPSAEIKGAQSSRLVRANHWRPPVCRRRGARAPFSSRHRALRGHGRRLARSVRGVRRAPFAGRVALVSVDKLRSYPGLDVVREAPIIQMIADRETPAPSQRMTPVVLGPSDVPEMLRLAEQTHPGPFGPRTHELGHYIGVRIDGALAAMAGERMRLDGAVEISAVCVSPDHRGKGYAAFLVAWLARKLREEGATPFLHVLTDNASAIALYERLGFTTRKKLRLTVLTPGRVG